MGVRQRTTETIHRLHPDTVVFWSVAELVRQAGLRGLPITSPGIINALTAGRGPKVYGIVGVTVAIRPKDGVKWIEQQLEKRRRMKPTLLQRQGGIDERNFASL